MSKKGKLLEAIVAIKGDVDPSLKKSINSAESDLKSFGKKASGLGKNVAKAVEVGLVAAGTAVTVFTAGALDNATVMQKEMSNVATLLDGSTDQVAKRTSELQKEVLGVSNNLNLDTSDLTDGLYQVISAVGDSEDSISNLTIAAKAAKAGNATTTDSINLLTAVTKGYGDTSQEAFEKASDLAFQTVKLGQTSFPELASSIGKVTPLASALSMTQEELFGATATLTGVTGGTAEVMTQMKAVLAGLMSPSEGMGKALEELGYSSGSAAIESLGLQGTLEALSTTVDGDNQQLAKLFSSVEAQTAVLALAGSQAQNFSDKTKAMYEATGATSRAFDAQTNNLDNVKSSLKNLGKNFMTEIGLVALPHVEELAREAIPLVTEGLEDISPVVGSMATDFATNLLPIITSSLPGLVNGITAVLPAIGSIATTALPLITTIATDLTPIVVTLLPAAANGLSTVLGFVNQHSTGITALAAGIGAAVVSYKAYNAAMNAYKVISPIITALTASKAAADTAASVASGAAAASIGAETAAATAATGPTTALGVAVNAVAWPVLLVVACIGLLVAAVILVIKNFDKIKAVAKSVADTMCAVGTSIKNFFVTAFNGVVAAIKSPFNTVISMVNSVVAKINGMKIDIPDWVPGLGGKTFAINLPQLPMLATGGFTEGPSIAGEDGQEAVISFKRSVRNDNISYWFEAGERLGINFDKAYDTFAVGQPGYIGGGGTNNYYDMGGFSFNPVIVVKGSASKDDIDTSIREQREEFFDMLDEWWDDKTGGGGCFDPRY